MKRRKLLQNEPVWINAQKKDTVTAASQIVEADGETAIEIDLFYMDSLQCRYFADKKIFWSYIDGKWYQYRLANAARVSRGQDPLTGYWYDCISMTWHSDEDRERVYNFLGKSADWNEDIINGAKAQRAWRRKTERINREMGQVPTVPEGVEEWARKTLFPENYLFIDRRGSRTDYICTACGKKSWTKRKLKHREKAECPKCRAPVTVELRRERIEETKPLVILQRYDREKEICGIPAKEKVWIERQFKAHCVWEREKQIFLYEEIRVIIPEGKNVGEKVYYGSGWSRDEFEQNFWDHNSANKQFLKSWLYPENLKEVLAVAGLEHSGLIEMAAAGKKFSVNKYILLAKDWPWLEYLVKADLTDLAEDMLDQYWWDTESPHINMHADTLKELLKLDGNRTNRMKQVRGNLYTLQWLQYEQKREQEGSRIKISQESLEYLTQKRICLRNCEEILEILVSVNRMVDYMKKQRVSPNQLTQTWHDYLRMAQREGMDIIDNIIRLPKDLKARHDQLVETINQRSAREAAQRRAEENRFIDEQIAAHLDEAGRYSYMDDDYIVIPAQKSEQLIMEGAALHHCVGASTTYMERMAAGKTWILFLRKAEEPKKPYYTVEINMADDKILQWYSEFDRQPDKKEISSFLDKYKNSIGRKRARMAV